MGRKSKYFVRVDVTHEFPMIVTPWQAFLERGECIMSFDAHHRRSHGRSIPPQRKAARFLPASSRRPLGPRWCSRGAAAQSRSCKFVNQTCCRPERGDRHMRPQSRLCHALLRWFPSFLDFKRKRSAICKVVGCLTPLAHASGDRRRVSVSSISVGLCEHVSVGRASWSIRHPDASVRLDRLAAAPVQTAPSSL